LTPEPGVGLFPPDEQEATVAVSAEQLMPAEHNSEFLLRDEEASIVAEICRKLDGIPLAIELAAGRAAIFGLKDTAARLGSRLDLLKFGRPPRHQTLRATLDWSHDRLSELERILLRRIAIFVGHFTPESALAVAEEGDWTSAKSRAH